MRDFLDNFKGGFDMGNLIGGRNNDDCVDNSLLFFFLLLVIIFCNGDMFGGRRC